MRRNAVLFVAISLVSGFGSTAMSLVAGVWIIDLTGSAGLAGLAGLCVYAPTLAAPWLGAIVDRVPRRPLLIGADLALAGTLLSLFAVRSRAELWLIFVVMLAYGITYVLLDAGEAALLPAAVPARLLGDVNGWRSSAQEGMKLVAPLAGAALFAWRGAAPVAALSAAMPALAAVLYALVRPFRPATIEDQPVRENGPLAGLGVIWREPAIRVPVLVAAVAIAMSGFTTPAMYSAVTERAGLPAAFIGVLASAQGAGSIAGGLLAGRLLARTGPRTVAAFGATMFAIGTLSRCLTWPPWLIGGSALIGIGLPWTLVAGVTAIQLYTPGALLGRVAATANTAMFGPIAAFIPLGALAVRTGSVPPNVSAAAVCLAVAALATVWPRSRSRSRSRSGADPADPGPPTPDRRSWTCGA